MAGPNPYEPLKAKILEVLPETPVIKTFRLKLEKPLEFAAGQFIQVTVPGLGEFPVSPSSRPGLSDILEITVLQSGIVTESLHKKRQGELLGVRGPYGTGFPLEKLADRELIMAAEGFGIVRLRALILEMLSDRNRFPNITLIYSCGSSEEVIYRDGFKEWSDSFRVRRVADETGDIWSKYEGVIPSLFTDSPVADITACAAVAAGPALMMKTASESFESMGIGDERIWVSLEKIMSCGVGKCRRCLEGSYYVCREGPVSSYSLVRDITGLWGGI